jgi:putative transcriptional regulator
MPIIVNVDLMLARRKMRLNTLAEKVGITPQNLSVLKTGRAKAIRFSTLESLCNALDCQPGEILSYERDAAAESSAATDVTGPEPSEV